EVDVALAQALVAPERVVLAYAPIRVRAEQVRVEHRHRECCPAVPAAREPREDGLELREKAVRERANVRARGIAVRRGRVPGAGDVAAAVVDEDASRASLPARDVPRILVAGVRVRGSVREPPRAVGVPEPVRELQLELAVPPR